MKTVLKIIGILVTLATICVILLLLYSYGVSKGFTQSISLSSKNADWGALGAYLGGTLSPFLSLLSILFVWYQGDKTAKDQQKQITTLNEQMLLQRKRSF